MAAPKKTTKAATAKKKPVAKKAPVKKAPVKTSTKKTAAKKQPVKSFRLSRNEKFFATSITIQTIYWSILSIFIMLMFIWVLNIQLDIAETLDQINRDV